MSLLPCGSSAAAGPQAHSGRFDINNIDTFDPRFQQIAERIGQLRRKYPRPVRHHQTLNRTESRSSSQLLAAALNTESLPGFLDLYLERRLEIQFEIRDGILEAAESRSDGSALRIGTAKLRNLQAATGIGPKSIASMLDSPQLSRSISRHTPRSPAPLEAPDDWGESIGKFLEPLEGTDLRLRLLLRHAALIRDDSFRLISTPALLRLEVEKPQRGRMLGVWGHPSLESWRDRLLEKAPRRTWKPPSGESFPVLLGEGCSGTLFHEIAGHLLEGDLLHRSSAIAYPGKSAHTPATLRVTDDPARRDLPGSFSSDDEGIEAEKKVLIEGGLFHNALCDRKTAAEFGLRAGRGRRAYWNSPPGPRMSNIVIDPGPVDPRQMEEDIRKGLLVTRIGGASLDPESGRAQLRIEEGWEIRRGKRRRPLAPFFLGAGIIELLRGIRGEIGSDRCIDFRLGWCFKNGLPVPTGSEGPSILLENMEVL